MSTCRSCGANIRWIKMQSGKYMPCDCPKRSMMRGYGDDVIVTEDGNVVQGTFASYENGANISGYVSHFSTCPNAKQHRRR